MSILSGPTSTRWTAVGVLAAVTSALVLVGLPLTPSQAYAAIEPVDLGTAETYSVIGGTEITIGDGATVTGDLGLSPNGAASITGLLPGTVAGETHAGDGEAAQALADLQEAYADALSRTMAAVLTADPIGLTLFSGIYQATVINLSANAILTLDGQNDPGAVFLIQVGSALNTGADSQIVLTNGAQACNVFWQVGSSATLGARSTFVGTIMAYASTTVGANVTVFGRVLVGAAITLGADSHIITQDSTPGCPAAVFAAQVAADAAAAQAAADAAAGAAPAAPVPAPVPFTAAPVIDSFAPVVTPISVTPMPNALPQAGGTESADLDDGLGQTNSASVLPDTGGSPLQNLLLTLGSLLLAFGGLLLMAGRRWARPRKL